MTGLLLIQIHANEQFHYAHQQKSRPISTQIGERTLACGKAGKYLYPLEGKEKPSCKLMKKAVENPVKNVGICGKV